MKYLQILIFTFILNIPVLASNQNWEYIGQLDGNRGFTYKLECHDSLNCYTITQNNKFMHFFHSTNQGNSWVQRYKVSFDSLAFSGTYAYYCRDISSPDPNHYYILFQDNFVIYKSKDGGYNWKKITIEKNSPNNHIRKIEMYDSLNGIAASYYHFYFTNDGWETFTKIEQEYKYLPRMIKYQDKNNILVHGNDSVSTYFANYSILENKFKKYYEMEPQSNGYKDGLMSLFSINDNIKFCAGSRKHIVGDQSIDIIYKTSDGGKNWEKVLDSLHGWPYTSPESSGSPFGLQDISCYDENNCLAVGAWGKAVMTKDGGKTWVYEPEGDTPFKQANESVYGPPVMKVTWAGTIPLIGTFEGNFYRYKGNFFGFGTSVEDTQPIYTSIFPNPSSDKILLDLGGVAVADLVVYDILGNEILSIPNYTNKSEIDIRNLSIGTYTIQIQTSTGSKSQRLLKY